MSVDTHPAYKVTDALTRDNSAEFATTRGLLCIVGGAVHVGFQGGGEATFSSLPVGWHPMRINKLFLTGTDASVELHGAY